MTEDASKTDPITRIRAMLSSADRGSLATNQRDMDGWPYASLVMMAVDEVGAPLLLISTLADHTRNLMEDPRASLLIDATVGLEEPLTGARATVLGHLEKSDAAAHRQAYLQRHPSASMYAGFTDFAIWRMTIKRAHLVAGFGDIHWVDWPQG